MAASKVKLAELSVRELLEMERAAHIICAKYENMNKMENFLSVELNNKFLEMRERYDKVVEEIERRVKEI